MQRSRLFAVAALVSIGAIVGCGGGPTSGPDAATSSGKVDAATSNGGPDAAPSTAAADAGTGGTAIAWKGTWSVHLTYGVTCDVGFGNTKHGDIDQTNTVQIAGDNTSLTLTTTGNFEMTGSGHADSLTLSGDYPVRNNQDNPASPNTPSSPNNVTFKLDTVSDPKDASGTVSGSFDDDFGDHCTIDSGGNAMFSR